MIDKVIIEKYDEVYIKIYCEPSIGYELRDYFSFDVPGAKFMPSYKSKVWDGKIKLYNPLTGLLYAGLRKYVEKFCDERKYDCVSEFLTTEFSLREAEEYIKILKLPFELRDYQVEGFVYAIRNHRALLLSATASGKSIVLYLITRYLGLKTLIIVPTIGLVIQMQNDFKEYGYIDDIHTIYSGQEKQTEHLVSISTWQSLFRLPKAFFSKYQLVIVDECHTAKAKSLTSILTKLTNCKYRIGVTGTLDSSLTHKFVLEGLFNPVKKLTTAKELMEAGHVSNLKIKCVILNYPLEVKRDFKKLTYQDEIARLLTLPDRNRFIRNLALSLKGNTLVLFRFVDHGKSLFHKLREESMHRKVYFVYGGVETEERERIRNIVEEEENAIIVASMGTFKMGVNIRKLHNIIFTHPSKDRITILQAIGRTLRLDDAKDYATLFDICDDLSIKTWKNFTLLHFIERVKIYAEENFSYRIYQVNLRIDS